jgi:large subunit ribosomal protein L17
MKKQVFGRQLKRDTNERKALFKGLVSSLTMYERIETTEEKAKAIKGHVEKLVTKAKKNNSVQARQLLQAYLTNEALQKMVTDVAPRFSNRPGGYTRILKTGNRFSDNASMVIMEWVEKGTKIDIISPRSKKSSVKNDAVESETKIAKPKKVTKAAPKKTVKAASKKEDKKKVTK